MSLLLRLHSAAIVLGFCTAFTTSALADFEAAESAAQKQDYVTARKELEALSGGTDARVFRLLAEFNRDGRGAPPDLVESYKDFSLESMFTSDPDERGTAFGLRRQVARKLTKDGILEGENRVEGSVISRLGKVAVDHQVELIASDLAACKTDCEPIALTVFGLGPAAAKVVPQLEILMTRDRKWTPRETYAYALAYIGTRGVPALSRLMADEEEWRTEGLWNLQQCAAALGSLGPTAAAARPALMQALTRSYQGFGGEYNEMAKAFQLTPDEAASEIKIVLIQALVNVSDPQREVRDDLMRYMEAEKSPKLRLIAAWGVGLLYAEVRPGLNLAETTLAASDTTDTELQLAALAVLDDFNSIPEAHEKIGLLLPAIRKLADGANDDIKDAASKILDNVAQPSINAAIQWMKKRDFKAAIKEVNTALSINPTSTESIQIRAEAERETGDLDGAVKDYSAALDSSDYVFWASTP